MIALETGDGLVGDIRQRGWIERENPRLARHLRPASVRGPAPPFSAMPRATKSAAFNGEFARSSAAATPRARANDRGRGDIRPAPTPTANGRDKVVRRADRAAAALVTVGCRFDLSASVTPCLRQVGEDNPGNHLEKGRYQRGGVLLFLPLSGNLICLWNRRSVVRAHPTVPHQLNSLPHSSSILIRDPDVLCAREIQKERLQMALRMGAEVRSKKREYAAP